MRKAIDDRRALLDKAEDLGEFSITVRLVAGSSHIKGVSIEEHRVARRAING